MASLNKVLLIGNLTKDPELRYTPNGTAVANFRLAVNRKFKDRSGELKEDTCFVTVTAWDKQAEACNQYLHKGRPVFVEGMLQSRSWETPDGQKRSVIDVRAERIQFLGQGQGQGRPGGAPGADEGGGDQPVEAQAAETVRPEDISWEE
ncbi:MAG: single-stranded DNA-binding protein [Elusimicrobia bacterium]|nr:single-stranded DNA-binding protein [Elusimicrobiota bacterium]